MLSAKAPRKFPVHGQAQAALKGGKQAGRKRPRGIACTSLRHGSHTGVARTGTSHEDLADFLDQLRQARLVGQQHLDTLFCVADLAGDALQQPAMVASLFQEKLAVASGAGLDCRQIAHPGFGVGLQSGCHDNLVAVAFDQLRRRARHVGQIVKLARRFGQVLAREREAQEIRRSARDTRQRARSKQAPERDLAGFQRLLLDGPARGQFRDVRARGARFRLCRLQRPVRVGNRNLGGAQRVACLAPVGLAALELGLERIDSCTQGCKVLLACCTGARAG